MQSQLSKVMLDPVWLVLTCLYSDATWALATVVIGVSQGSDVSDSDIMAVFLIKAGSDTVKRPSNLTQLNSVDTLLQRHLKENISGFTTCQNCIYL